MQPLRIGVFVVLLLACDRKTPVASERTPSSSVSAAQRIKLDVCKAGGGKADDVLGASLPRVVGELCIDPHADVRSYGAGAKAPLSAACEVVGGECAGYARFGLRRVLVVPYVLGADPRARVTVKLLALGTPEAAYALFSERVLGDAPDDFAAWKPVDASGTALVRGANGLAWRGDTLAELDYVDETSAPGRIAERGGGRVALLAQALVANLPGAPEPPRSVALLPKGDGGPLRTRFEHQDLFGISGLGAGAVAEYAPGGRRGWVAVLARSDDDAAKDVLKTFRRISGSRPLKGAAYETVGVSFRLSDSEPRLEWLFGRKRDVVFGVGRESERLSKTAAAAVRHREFLRLKSLLDDLRF